MIPQTQKTPSPTQTQTTRTEEPLHPLLPLVLGVPEVGPEDFEVIGEGLIMVDYKTPEQCRMLIEMIEQLDADFSYDPELPHATHDLNLIRLGLMQEADAFWSGCLNAVIAQNWPPYNDRGLHHAFALKYSYDTQKELSFHVDDSAITGTVKLNDNYTGGELIWPRYGLSNVDIPIGKMALFPGGITHGHYVAPLLAGSKYSLTFWSAQTSEKYEQAKQAWT